MLHRSRDQRTLNDQSKANTPGLWRKMAGRFRPKRLWRRPPALKPVRESTPRLKARTRLQSIHNFGRHTSRTASSWLPVPRRRILTSGLERRAKNASLANASPTRWVCIRAKRSCISAHYESKFFDYLQRYAGSRAVVDAPKAKADR
jgi:hypothetical protein